MGIALGLGDLDADERALARAAHAAAAHAYAPYSGFAVGAALRTRGGVIHVGCNVENAAYGVVLCAEVGALAAATVAGAGAAVLTIAVTGRLLAAGAAADSAAADGAAADGAAADSTAAAGAAPDSTAPDGAAADGTAADGAAAGSMAPDSAAADDAAADGVVVTPCGRCRQLILEAGHRARHDIRVLCCNHDLSRVEVFTIAQLLPHGFGPGNLGLG